MTTPFWCLLIAILIPYALAGWGGALRGRQFGSLDNKNPRKQQAGMAGMGARVNAAQQNAFEALPVFGAAVFVAHLAGADPARSATAALVFLAARVAHAVAYALDQDIVRSISFLLGFVSCMWLFGLAITA